MLRVRATGSGLVVGCSRPRGWGDGAALLRGWSGLVGTRGDGTALRRPRYWRVSAFKAVFNDTSALRIARSSCNCISCYAARQALIEPVNNRWLFPNSLSIRLFWLWAEPGLKC